MHHQRRRRATSPALTLAACIAASGWTAPRASATNVSGTLSSSTVWSPTGSPYVVTAALTVSPAGSLTIQPGVTVQIAAGVTLTAQGALHAEGTEQAPIVFTRRPQDAYGGSVNILGTGPDSLTTGVFSRCQFSYLTHGTAMLRGQYARLTVADSTFTEITTTVIRPVDSRAEVRRCRIYNTHEGINFVRCAGMISSNQVYNLLGDWDAVDLDAYWVGGGDDSLAVLDNHLSLGNDDAIDVNFAPALIAGNVLSNFTDKGISLGLGGDAPTDLAYGARAHILNNLILRCDMGVAAKDGSTPLIANTTIVDCNYGIRGYEKVKGGGGHADATNTIIWGCGVGVELLDGSTLNAGQCLIQGASPWPGPGNLNADPQFANPAAGNYRLLVGSPAVDAGVAMPWMSGAVDLDGRPRVAGTAPDMGAYELPPTALACNFSANPQSGPAPLDVVFTSLVTGADTGGLSFAWDFDADGLIDLSGPAYATATGRYTSVGVYAVSLQVTNAAGESATATRPACVNATGASTVYVATDSLPAPPYATWATAAASIADALTQVTDGGEVVVSNGLYSAGAGIVLDRRVWLHSVGGPAATTIDGGNTARCLRVTAAGCRIDGFTLTGGRTDTGAGVYAAADAVLSNCVIRGNHADANGGGAYLDQGGTLVDCVVTGNTAAANGGGLYFLRGGLADRCRVSGNHAPGGHGGGAYVYYLGSLRNTVVNGNEAGGNGGGVHTEYGGTLEQCTVAGNAAGVSGGGLRCSGGGDLVNTIVASNTAPAAANLDGSGVFTLSHCCTRPVADGPGNVDVDPLFQDAPAGDYRLDTASLCVNAGTNLDWTAGATDAWGNPRLTGDAPDIGAHEVPELACSFVAASAQGFTPLAVTFTASVAGSEATGLEYAWDFDGDGLTDGGTTGTAVAHWTYPTSGVFTVALSVRAASGRQARRVRPAAVIAAPGELFVSPAGGHRPPFATWADAATNIAAALAAAVDGVTVTVGEGTYPQAASLHLTQAVRLRAAGRVAYTRVLGNGTVRCLELDHAGARAEGLTLAGGWADYGGAVRCAAGVLAGCVVTGSTATVEGGGLYVLGTGVATGCVVAANSAGGAGGGAYLANGGRLVDCEVHDNSTGTRDGGGVMAVGGAAVVEACRVWNNRAGDDGGGIQSGDNNNVPGAVVRACRVWGNSAPDKGGGLMLWPGATADNCVVYSNRANEGGGVYFRGGGVLRHASIAGNSATATGGGLYSYGSATAYNCVSLLNAAPSGSNWYNRASGDVYRYCLTQPALAGAGNITGDPAFVAPPADLHLAAGSACIDAGTNLAAVALDADGVPRPLDGNADHVARADIGACEFVADAADTDGDGMPDGWEWAHELLLTVNDAGGDADADGFVNGDEWVAGTDPRAATSRLEIVTIEAASGAGAPTVAWPAVSGRLYTVDAATNWPAPGWIGVHSATGGAGGVLTWVVGDGAPVTGGFYRVRVERP